MNKIGCNTINVDPDCRMGVYSSETYERILKKYSRYTDWIKTLEFSHVTGIRRRLFVLAFLPDQQA